MTDNINPQHLTHDIKDYVMREFLPGEDPSLLLDSTALISGGILDSLAMVKFVSFLEGRYGIELNPQDITPDRFDNLAQIGAAVQRKLASKKS